MAYNVSSDFRNKLYSGESQFRATLTIGEQVIDNSQIASISISSPIVDDSKQVFYVGSFISQKITIHFKNMDGIDVISGENVELSIGQYVNNEWVDVPIGKFLIDDLAEDYYDKCEIDCYDYGVLFKPNIDYSPCFVDGKATIKTILEYICQQFSVELGDYPTVNDDIEIGTYDSTISGKQWISYIAEIKGCNAKIDRLGRLTLQPLKQPSSIPINALESESFETGEDYKITQVIFFDAVRNYTIGDVDGNTLYIRQDNPFINDINVVKNIYDTICTTKYSASGKSFDLDDVDAHNMILNTIYGETSQDTYSGKNLMDTIKSPVTIKGITITPNKDGSLTIKGTTTGAINQPLVNSSNPPILEAGTYTRSINTIGTLNNNGKNVILMGRDNNSTNVMGDINIAAGYNKTKTSTLTEQHTMSAIGLYVDGSGVVFDCVCYLQIEEGSTATPYEPYCGGTPSPNPDYPQEIHNVSGDIIITVHSNLLPYGYIGVDYIETSGTQYVDLNYLPKNNTKIETTVSFNELGNKAIFGEINGNYPMVLSLNSSNYWEYQTNSGWKSSTTSLAEIDTLYNIVYEHKSNEQYIKVNDTIVRRSTDSLPSNTASYSAYLFARNQNGIGALSKIKLYSFKLYDGETLLYNLIPCIRKSDNVVGLYNLVDNSFFVNNGTGTFTYGTVFEEREYKISLPVENKLDDSTYQLIGNTATLENHKLTLTNLSTNGWCRAYYKRDDFVVGQKYTLSCEFVNNNNNSTLNITIQDSNNSSAIATGTSTTASSGKLTLTFTATTTTHYIRLYSNYTATPNTNVVEYSNIQLEEGTKANTYVPYGLVPIGENLFDKDNANILDATINSSTKLIESSSHYKITYMPCKPNTTYTISKIQSNYLNMGFTDELPTVSVEVKNYINSVDTTKCTNTSLSTSKYLVIRYWRDNDTMTEQEIRNSIRIEEGSVSHANDHAIELNKIGTYQDYIYKENDKWYLHKEIGKVVFDGSELWQDRPNFNDCDRFVYDTSIIPTQPVSGLSNYFIVTNASYSVSTIGYLRTSQGDQVIINFSEKGTTSLAQFKTWLGNNKPNVYYILSSATNTEITYQPLIDQLNAIQNDSLLEGTNHITIEPNDLTPTIDIDYFKNSNFTLTSLKTHNYGDFTLDAWDNIDYDLDGTHYLTLNNNEITYEMSIMSDVDTKIPTKQQEVTTNIVSGDDKTNIKKIKTRVDNLDASVEILSQQQTTTETNLSQLQIDVNGIEQNVEHIENVEINGENGIVSQIASVRTSVNNITNMFQITGGINVIRNSAFLLSDEVWEFTNNGSNPYHTELGNSYNSTLSGSTVSVAEIKLRSIKVKSKSENVTNLLVGTNYTFNFYHKQDNNMTTTIKMYSTENNSSKAFDDIVITGQQPMKSYNVSFTPSYTNYTIEIIVTSSANVGYAYLYDMMLNSGDIQSWQPASDEIYSTTLTMSRLGLKVYSIGDGTITLLGSDGMLTYETTDGKTLGRLVSSRTVDGDRTRNVVTQSIYLTRDITQENLNRWVETIINVSNRPYKVEYVESGE